MLHGFDERFPAHVLLWPVRVQGETCAAEVAAAIRGFNALPPGGPMPRPDVLIVARGGGSLEDLWGFNEEIVVRAAAASTIPLISAVGHETDWTLIDLAADARAPTPTKAAEWAVPKYAELVEQTGKLGLRLQTAARRALDGMRAHLRAAARGLPRRGDLLALPRQRFDAVDRRLGRALLANTRAHGMRAGALCARGCSRGCWKRAWRARATGSSAGPARDGVAGAQHRTAPRAAGARRRAACRRRPIVERMARCSERAGVLRCARAADHAYGVARHTAPSRRLRQAAGLAQLPGRAAARLCAGARQRGPQRALGGAGRPRPAARHRARRRPCRAQALEAAQGAVRQDAACSRAGRAAAHQAGTPRRQPGLAVLRDVVSNLSGPGEDIMVLPRRAQVALCCVALATAARSRGVEVEKG